MEVEPEGRVLGCCCVFPSFRIFSLSYWLYTLFIGMSFYKFEDRDIVHVSMNLFPQFDVSLNGDQVTGSVYLDKQYLNDDLENRLLYGFSRRLGGYVSKLNPLTSSISMFDAQQDTTTNSTYRHILQLYDYYSFFNANTYTTGSSPVTLFRVINFPSVYYDREILSGSLTASDWDASGNKRNLYDDGNGAILSGSTVVGNVFYAEGIACLYGSTINDFGSISSLNTKWEVSLRGTHTIPVSIWNCRAPSGELNATSNPTFYQIPTNADSDNTNEREIVLTGSDRNTWVTKIGIYNKRYELVATAHLAQPIRKKLSDNILFRLRMDF
jgi:hypothetical protein